MYPPGRYIFVWNDEAYEAEGQYAFKLGSLSSNYLRCEDAAYCSYSQAADMSYEDIDFIVIVGDVDDSIGFLSQYTISGEISSGVNEVRR